MDAVTTPTTIFSRAALRRALAVVAPATENRTNISVLNAVLLRHKDGETILRATNLEQEITYHLDIDGGRGEDIEVAIPVKTFQAVVHACPLDRDLHLAIEDGRLSVRCDDLSASLEIIDVADFPTAKPFEAYPFSMKAHDLLSLIVPVRHAVSTKEVRYYLNGICFEGNGHEIICAGTDGHRLAQRRIQVADVPAIKPYILPRAAATMLCTLLPGHDTVTVRQHGWSAEYTIGNVVFRIKLIDGDFPDYRRVIPKKENLPSTYTFDARAFLNAMEMLGRFILTHHGEGVRLDLSEAEGCWATVKNFDSTLRMPLPGIFRGTATHISFQQRYLKDAMTQASGEMVMHLGDSQTNPVVITPAKGREFTIVLMPLRIE